MAKPYTLTSPQLSPDGKSVLILVSKPDTTSNKNKSFVYKVDVENGATLQLTYDRTGIMYPKWSPSSNAIAFIANDEANKSQVFALSLNGGEAKKITSSSVGVQTFAWSPDGSTFAFTQQDELANKKEVEKGYDAFEVQHNGMYLNEKPISSHIWLISSNGGDAKRLTNGNWSVAVSAALSWSPERKSPFKVMNHLIRANLFTWLKQLKRQQEK